MILFGRLRMHGIVFTVYVPGLSVVYICSRLLWNVQKKSCCVALLISSRWLASTISYMPGALFHFDAVMLHIYYVRELDVAEILTFTAGN